MNVLVTLGPDQSRWNEVVRALIDRFLPTLDLFTSRSEALEQLRKEIWKDLTWSDRKDYDAYDAARKVITVQTRMAVAPTPHSSRPIWMASRSPWLMGVECDSCLLRNTKLRGGCIECFKRHDQLAHLRSHDDFVAGLKLCRDKPTELGPRLVLADWLEERGFCDLAEFLRRTP